MGVALSEKVVCVCGREIYLSLKSSVCGVLYTLCGKV